MRQPKLHLVKLSVGSESPADLAAWQASARAQGPDGLPRHVTRMWPKRSEELLQGGSLYWVIKGTIRVRQRVLRLDEVEGADGIRRCGIVLDPTLMLTKTKPKRPFQGWRYLKVSDAPADTKRFDAAAQELPDQLKRELEALGVL